MKTQFIQLIKPTTDIVEAFTKWDNDSKLRPLIRPNKNQADIENISHATIESFNKRLEHSLIYLIYLDYQLVGQMSFQTNFIHLYKNEPNTAWIGMGIGEAHARGLGVGTLALTFLEKKIKQQGMTRIELGVFSFNKPAHKLYKNCGYQEIGRTEDFTFWRGEMWSTIHMEKYLK